jgi:methylthioribose-1-phosphate isomerase
MDDTQTPPAESEVIDGEIVSDDASAVVDQQVTSIPADGDQAQVLLSLEEMIKSHIASLDRIFEERKKLKDMLADGFANDANFKQVSDKVKEVNKEKSAVRQQIMNRPGMLELANKVKDFNVEMKEKEMALSDYLLEYQRMAQGVNEIEGYDGEVREIIQVAKLVKKAKPQK